MSKDNKTNLKADHGQHSGNQPPKQSKHSFIGFMSIMACLLMLLLIASCQPVNVQTLIKSKVNNHASLK
ncbi:hypothetical protein [Psychrobacter maritimus]|uniref:hypothetical protein n=1 Tax=Psychrobacter maritimus TaxID=256325 RepID=UPI0039AFBFAA